MANKFWKTLARPQLERKGRNGPERQWNTKPGKSNKANSVNLNYNETTTKAAKQRVLFADEKMKWCPETCANIVYIFILAGWELEHEVGLKGYKLKNAWKQIHNLI